MTIYDIAKEAGVSASTVSRVMNNKPGLKAETRAKVMAVVNKYNFSLDENARSLVRQETKTIGLLVPDVRIGNYMMGIHTIIGFMASKGYCCVMLDTGLDNVSRAEYVKLLSQRRMQGAIFVDAGYQCDEVEEAVRLYFHDKPVVMVNGSFDLPNVYSVACDEGEGTAMCFDYIFEKGYKYPAYIGCGSELSKQRRMEGMKKSVAKNAHEREIPVYMNKSPFECGYGETETALREHPETDVLVYSSDSFAVMGMSALHDLGIKVPDDISVITAEESRYSALLHPYMTSLDTKIEVACEIAGYTLMDILEGNERPKTLVLKPEINERETTKNMK